MSNPRFYQNYFIYHKNTKRNATKTPNHLVNSFIFIIFVRIWRMGN